ncbi:MAG: thiamine phosphate synthase [Chlamydiae bacterium]|nr:thiamine phosphate synthase [Chlamydiota bacterium]MBI3277710.1 thiamine phosphate synthase [Chlamydiota bacterium]
MKKSIQGKDLYAILDRGYLEPDQMVDVATRLVEGGCELIQFRDKISPLSEVLRWGLKVKAILPFHVVFILNDYVELVKEMGADGVHLGQEDYGIKEARKILGNNLIIGLSTHSKEQAIFSSTQDVDYIGWGPVFKTQTKPKMTPIGLEYLPGVKEKVSHPIFAIGGIDSGNVVEVLEKGADGVAVVSAILKSSDIFKTTSHLLSKIRAFREGNQFTDLHSFKK